MTETSVLKLSLRSLSIPTGLETNETCAPITLHHGVFDFEKEDLFVLLLMGVARRLSDEQLWFEGTMFG